MSENTQGETLDSGQVKKTPAKRTRKALLAEKAALTCAVLALANRAAQSYDDLAALAVERPGDDDAADAAFEDVGHIHRTLAAAVFEIIEPRTVGDIAALEHEDLRQEGLIYLIERDASEHYDQIDGFSDFVCMDGQGAAAKIALIPRHLDGLGYCQWIEEADDARKFLDAGDIK